MHGQRKQSVLLGLGLALTLLFKTALKNSSRRAVGLVEGFIMCKKKEWIGFSVRVVFSSLWLGCLVWVMFYRTFADFSTLLVPTLLFLLSCETCAF